MCDIEKRKMLRDIMTEIEDYYLFSKEVVEDEMFRGGMASMTGLSSGVVLRHMDGLCSEHEKSLVTCGCFRCTHERTTAKGLRFPPVMIVCDECGNKRCPHATDHNLKCTGSNEPGQRGSRYGGMS